MTGAATVPAGRPPATPHRAVAGARPVHGPGPRPPAPAWWVAAAVLAPALAVVIMRLWRADGHRLFFAATATDPGLALFRRVVGPPPAGAPGGLAPSGDLHLLAAWLLGRFTADPAWALNLYFLFGFAAIGVSAFWFLHRCGLRPPWALVLAALYADAPYHFQRGEGDIALASYFLVPPALGLALHVLRGEPLWGRDRRRSGVTAVLLGPGARSLTVAVLVAASSAYYALFTVYLVAAAGVAAVIRSRDLARLRDAVGVCVAATGTVLALLWSGSGAARVTGPRGDVERYSLKIASLILPAPGHPVAALAALRNRYDTAPNLPSERPALGLVAACGFLLLLLLPLVVVRRLPTADRVAPRPGWWGASTGSGATLRQLAFLTWAAFLAATFGGLSSLLAAVTAAAPEWNRMSIFLALLALAGAGLALQGAVGWLITRRSLSTRLHAVAAAVLLLVGGFDQSLTTARQPAAAVHGPAAPGSPATPGPGSR